MAGELKIRAGSKLSVALDVPVGKEPDFNMLSSFNKSLDESCFLISIPMKGGKPMEMDEAQKLLIRYTQGTENYIIAGYVDDVVKEGIRKFWKIRRVVEQRTFFQRRDERAKVALPVKFIQDTWPRNIDGEIVPEEGLTLDISAGGAAVYSNRRFEVGEILMLDLPNIGASSLGKGISDVVCAVCWNRETPKGSQFRMLCGLQYHFADGPDRKKMEDYVAYVKRRYKL